MTAPGTTVEVRGADTFVRTLTAAARDLEAMAPKPAGQYVRDRARGRAPFRTGRLRSSIQDNETDGLVTIASGLEYSAVIHNGWAGHNIAPNPYLIPAAEETAETWGRAYEDETARIVGQVRGE